MVASPHLRSILRALRHRNYRLFFAGQGVSLVGTWLSRVATAWLVYRLTDSALVLGVLGFVNQIPTFFFAALGGAVVDRFSRHRILVGTQFLSMLQSFALAYLALSGRITVGQILALSLFQGMVNALDNPARQAFVVEMVENREDLSNAIALNSSMFNGARLVGPAIGGILLTSLGEGYLFLVDGFSYLAVIASLLLMRIGGKPAAASPSPIIQGIGEGFRYAFGFPPVRAILVLAGLVSLVAMPYTVLMPIFARDILGGGPNTLGFLMAGAGVGALAGALYLASRVTVRGLGTLIASTAVVTGVGLAAFSESRSPWLSYVLMTVVGFGMIVVAASSNTVLQTVVDDDKRGRVMSLYAMAFLGMSPFGNLLAGALASKIGAPATLLLGGLVCIAGGLEFARRLPRLREMVRPIYVDKGIIVEAVAGIQSATVASPPPDLRASDRDLHGESGLPIRGERSAGKPIREDRD